MSALKGRMGANRGIHMTRSTRVLGWEAMLLLPIVPYMLMFMGTLGCLAMAWGLRIWVRDRPTLMAVMSGVLVASVILLSILAWKLYKPLTTNYAGIGFFLAQHVVSTLGLAHVNVYLFMLFGSREFTWASWILGSIFIIISWMLRRMARQTTMTYSMDDGAPISLPGSSFLVKGHDSQRVLSGPHVMAIQPVVEIERTTLKLGPGLTVKDAFSKRDVIAAARQLPARAVRLEYHPSQREDLVDVCITRQDPFKLSIPWQGPYNPGASIAEMVYFATAEDGNRTGIYFPGSKTHNSQHWLVMGASGTGKSKCWQCIYGEVLSRREVAVILADPVKGIQTAGPLIEGLTWFADTEATTKAVIRSIPGAIRERTNYLAHRGLDEWEPDCGIEYLIYHIEESGGLANKGFVTLAERARSAGITLVLSLQRASGDRMSTSVRYNLGGSMCFGCRELVDARFALSATTLEQGAIPHIWRNRKRGQFYLEADGIDISRFAIPNKVDWLTSREHLEEMVRAGARYRKPLSDLTAAALGSEYARYVRETLRGEASWQKAMAGHGSISGIDEIPDAENETWINQARTKANLSDQQPVSTQAADAIVWAWISEREPGSEFTFDEICEAVLPAVERSKTWLNLRLKGLIEKGKLPQKRSRNIYTTPYS